MTWPLTTLRDRAVAPGERRSASVGVLAVLVAVLLLTGPPRSAPSHARRSTVSSRASVTVPQATSVARRFLHGYLAYAYQRARADAVTDAPQALIATLQRNRPRAVIPHAHIPRIVALALARDSRGRPVIDATLNDRGIVNYTIGLLLAHQAGRLLVTEVQSR